MARDDQPKKNKTTILYGESVAPTRKVTPDYVDPDVDFDAPAGDHPPATGLGESFRSTVAYPDAGKTGGQAASGARGTGSRSGPPTQIHTGEKLMPLPRAEGGAQALLDHLAKVAGIQVDPPALFSALKSALGISVEPIPLIENLAKMAGVNLVLQEEPVSENPRPVTGWLVVIKGPGKGFSQPLTVGRNQIGRAPDQSVPINYGDLGISRDAHFFITYDPRSGRFLCSPGERQVNLCYINDEPLVETVPLKQTTDIEISDSVLRFVPLCGETFKWTDA